MEAQKNLFATTEYGDLTRFISSYFDTRIGSKLHADSYRKIVEAEGVDGAGTLFISDSLKELDAARQAGLTTQLSVRPGNAPITDSHTHAKIDSFLELLDR